MAKKNAKIRGITIELNGDTSGLAKSLSSVNSKIKDTQAQLKDVNKLLKLDPGNTELLTQKQKLLTDAVKGTNEKLEVLKKARDEANEAVARGDENAQKQLDALQREIIETEQELKSLTREAQDFGSVGAQQFAAVGAKVKDVGDKVGQLGSTLTKNVTGPIVAVAGASVAAFNDVDEGLDIIIKKTGASGDALKDMEERAKNLTTTIPTDFKTAGEAIGEVNTRFGLTGQELEDLSAKFIKFSSLNDTSVSSSIDGVQAAMAAMGVSIENAGNFLDILNKAGQDTGVSMDKLTGDLSSNATVLREMGFHYNTAVGFLANLSKNGVDASSVLTGLKTALKNATKDGKSMSQAMAELMGKIKGAKSETEAMQIAAELFGSKAGPAMAKAIRDGRLSFDEFSSVVWDAGDSIERTFEATLDPIDEFKMILNELKITGAEIVADAGPLIKDLAETIKGVVHGIRSAWEGLSQDQKEMIIKLAGMAAAAGPLLVVVSKLIGGISGLLTLAPKLTGFIQTISGGVSALFGLLAANPVGAIIAGIAAVVAALVWAYNNIEGFRKFVDNTIKSIVTLITSLPKIISDAFSNLANAALNWGRDLINNFITGIKQMWENAKHAVSNFAGMIKRFLGFSEPEDGPLSNFHTYAPDMMKLFAKGILDNEQLVSNAINRAFDVQPTVEAPEMPEQARQFTVPRYTAAESRSNMTVILELNQTELARTVFALNNAEVQRRGLKLDGVY